MKNKSILAILCAVSLITASALGKVTLDAQETQDTMKQFYRIESNENNGLIHYNYIDENGNEVVLPTSQKKSSVKKSNTIPSSYDSRDQNVITSIKDQGLSGSCWAFGALKAMEASSISQGLSALTDTDYSENHLAWYSYQPVSDVNDPLYGDFFVTNSSTSPTVYNAGGSAYVAISALSNWWGAAAEADAPFSAESQSALNTMAASMRQAGESLRNNSIAHLREANCYDYSDLDTIKDAIMQHGALDVALHYPDSNSDSLYTDGDLISLYQNRYTSEDSNHCVTIIGWDDDFNTFSNTPEQSGAWLMANSYGTSNYSADGCFWVSYYDTSLCEFYSFEAEDSQTYENNFQYDGIGWAEGYTDSSDITLANVFTNELQQPQQIGSVGFYTFADGQEYEISVYRNIKGDSPVAGELVSETTTAGTADFNGYHTVELKNPIAVGKGERFSILVKFRANLGTSYALFEGNDYNSNYKFGSEEGQSYVYFDSNGYWQDNTSFRNGKTVSNNNNVCIKAYTNSISDETFEEQEKDYIPPTDSPQATTTASVTPTSTPSVTNTASVTFTPQPSSTASVAPTVNPTDSTVTIHASGASKIVLGKGESVSLPVTFTPASAKQSCSFDSSNKSLVSVSKSGKVKGLKTGTSKITVHSNSTILKTITVTVKKAPSSIRTTTKKASLKNGKTRKLKIKLSKNSASYQLRFHSSNKKVATVSSSGVIKAKKAGIVTIRISTYNNKKTNYKIRIVK